MTEVESIITRGKSIRDSLLEMLHRHEFTAESKNILLAAYTDIAIEHHESIHLLIAQKLCGSAFALVRPLFETLYRAHWVNKCASDEQIEAIYNQDSFNFPKTTEMVKMIDESYSTENFFMGIKLNSWSAMCSYTHTGLLPISRRFTGTDVKPNYDTGEILEVLNSSNMAILLIARLFFVSLGKSIEAQEAEKMILEYGQNATLQR